VHSANGMHPGVLQLPDGWEKPDFAWPRGPRMMTHMDVGAHNPEQVAQLGIKLGDFVTIPKKYHKLLGRRAAGRAFDDRIGCAALVSAAWALGPNLNGRDVTFIWSTSEELGLEGAAQRQSGWPRKVRCRTLCLLWIPSSARIRRSNPSALPTPSWARVL